MKSQFLLLALMACLSLSAQSREELLQELTSGTCSCMEEKESSVDQLEMAIGLCVLQASSGKTDQIESVLGYSLVNQADMTALGEELGMRLMMNCPSFQALMMEAMESGELDDFLPEDFDEAVPEISEDSGGAPLDAANGEQWMAIDRPDTEEDFAGEWLEEDIAFEDLDADFGDFAGEALPAANGEEWSDIDRPNSEEEFGDGPSSGVETLEAEVFPPTEEEWSDIERPATEEAYGNGPSEGNTELEAEVFPPTEEEWSDIERPTTEEAYGNGPSEGNIELEAEVFPPTEEEWSDMDPPVAEEEYGNGSSVIDEETFPEVEEEWTDLPTEVFPPTEEEWSDIDAPATEEDYGNGPSEDIDYDGDYPVPEPIEEYFPPTEEEWNDIDTPATEEDYGNGASEDSEGNSETTVDREFITTPMPNTNSSGLIHPSLSGQIRRINSGPVSEILMRGDDRQTYSFLLSNDIPGAALLQRRAQVTITYREVLRFDARTGSEQTVREILRVE